MKKQGASSKGKHFRSLTLEDMPSILVFAACIAGMIFIIPTNRMNRAVNIAIVMMFGMIRYTQEAVSTASRQ